MNPYYKYCFGENNYPPDIFQEYVQNLKDLLSKKKFKRVKSFQKSNMEIYPKENPTQYIVISHKETGYDIKYVEINPQEQETNCTCADNFYRGIECKHIWGVRLFMKNNVLPEPGKSRLLWYLDKLRETKEKTKNSNKKKIIDFTIQNLQEDNFEYQNIEQVSKILSNFSHQETVNI